MKHYQEISLLPMADIHLYFVWQRLFENIHKALAENKAGPHASAIGAGFPEYDAQRFTLGAKLRLFAPETGLLEKLHCEKRLKHLKDYVHVRSVMPAPEKPLGYACFSNKKLKGSREKLARRRAKRQGESFEQALAHYDTYEEQTSKLPYINMASQTTGERFRLFIKYTACDRPKTGMFSCYGLSHSSTVPLF